MDAKWADLVSLFTHLGFSDPASWSVVSLRRKANSRRTLLKLLGENTAQIIAAPRPVRELLLKMAAVLRDGGRVEVVGGPSRRTRARARRSNPAGRPAAGATRTGDPAPYLRPDGRPGRGAPPWVRDWYLCQNPRPPAAGRGVGIIARVIKELLAAGRDGRPVTKGQLLALARAHFPDRDPEKLATTVNNLPHRLKRWYGVDVHRRKLSTGQWGYWAESAPAAAGTPAAGV